ncbi:ABC transporter ATP-binding protein [Halapricum hydrolyticum]|uniref:ABC transporter ATP-binding protein n=1 Tax=Halapricum hydrolyticum TaxID=2979991 RepID=A0AAE3LGW4_9EURY|nr:ABC transporter ATP-binding protein [Halapricum hydrolyticum]MCU4717327.1 ABC transporter ATP-binding protein [Halapricum hydrolyticum]MCU4726254.1 ABC transporter ATP-binding protein [Halapricum hydrolyticum]
MSTPPSITVEGLRREFGPITALDGVDLALDGPAIVGIAGPNGSGKTTLIKCLLGLLGPTGGSSAIGGADSLSLSHDDRARIGYMPQHEAVYRDLTVRENLAFFASLYDLPDRERAVDRALSFVDLHERADARISDLSGGMIRRASLACALVHDPDVVFLDEPTVGLDPKLRANMWDAFRRRREAGALILVSTHYLGEVRNCDRVLFLRDGRVLAFDTPTAFLDRTGAEDMEGAFLALLEKEESA